MSTSNLGLLEIDLTLVAGELEVDGSGGSGNRNPECLPNEVRDPLHSIYSGVEFGDGAERGYVVDLLIYLRYLVSGFRPPVKAITGEWAR